ncbi:hypothetical protein LIER_26908 [Lithospermum erythrorhizon]|uniref:Uncharacterized protein n=1 Tax=Lithospermum erythrorhizon TaxID=34254 RepID=A0AAV3RE35_LITER
MPRLPFSPEFVPHNRCKIIKRYIARDEASVRKTDATHVSPFLPPPPPPNNPTGSGSATFDYLSGDVYEYGRSSGIS